MTRTLRAELLDHAGAMLGEGPTWDLAIGRLAWVDILGRQVHLSDSGGGGRVDLPTGDDVGAVLPAAGGGWLLALRDRFARLRPDGTLQDVLPVLDSAELRFNDAKCDPSGRAWGGTMRYDEAPGSGTLYRLDTGPLATPVLTGQGLCNGLGWSPDGAAFYFIDSLAHTVRVFDYDDDTGAIRDPRVVARVDIPGVIPDGMCVDDSGCLWVALYGGGAVHRYTPDGVLDATVELPVTQVTSCAFGGAAADRLYITTAAQQLDAAALRDQPYAGGLFAVDPGVTGPAATAWRG